MGGSLFCPPARAARDKFTSEFEYPDLGTVRVRVNLDEPMKIAAIGTIADCKLPNTFFFRQIASDFATTD